MLPGRSIAETKWHQQDTLLQAAQTNMHNTNWQQVWINFLAQCHKEWYQAYGANKKQNLFLLKPLWALPRLHLSLLLILVSILRCFFWAFSPLSAKGGLCRLIWGWTRFLNWSTILTFFLFAVSNVFIVITSKLSPDKWQYSILQTERLAGPLPVELKLHHAK